MHARVGLGLQACNKGGGGLARGGPQTSLPLWSCPYASWPTGNGRFSGKLAIGSRLGLAQVFVTFELSGGVGKAAGNAAAADIVGAWVDVTKWEASHDTGAGIFEEVTEFSEVEHGATRLSMRGRWFL